MQVQPLIKPPNSHPFHDPVSIPAWYGYALLTATYIIFIVLVNSMLKCWKFVIAGLEPHLRNRLTAIFEKVDEYVVALWCVYIVLWWWALLLWIGYKLFRQSKGLGSVVKGTRAA